MNNKALWNAGRALRALGVIAFVGCSSSSAPEQAPVPVEQASSDTNLIEVGQWTGRWDAVTKQLTFEPIANPEAPGFHGSIAEEGFAQVAAGKLTFTTQWAVTGPDDTFGCPAGQLCALVSAVNSSTRPLYNTYAEVTKLTPTGYEGSNSDSVPAGYPLSNAKGLWAYYDLGASGGGIDREWRFNQPGTASFSFQVRVMASFARTSYTSATGSLPLTGTWSDSAPVWRDACAMNGHTTILTNTSMSDYAMLPMPFPFTLYDWNFSTQADEMTISTAGTLGLFPANFDNSTLPNGNLAGNLFAFWDDIYTGAEGVCYATTGSTPNRYFVATWPKAHITGFPETWLNFSVVLRETDDNVWYLYNRWSDNLTDCTSNSSAGALRARGSSATTGSQGLNSEKTLISYNSSTYLPVHTSECTANGKWYKLTASAANNVFP